VKQQCKKSRGSAETETKVKAGREEHKTEASAENKGKAADLEVAGHAN
jgi:hypothetical protein